MNRKPHVQISGYAATPVVGEPAYVYPKGHYIGNVYNHKWIDPMMVRTSPVVVVWEDSFETEYTFYYE